MLLIGAPIGIVAASGLIQSIFQHAAYTVHSVGPYIWYKRPAPSESSALLTCGTDACSPPNNIALMPLRLGRSQSTNKLNNAVVMKDTVTRSLWIRFVI
ncbi:hypothetical protein D3C81_1320240 [compost metagenome]